MHEFVRKGVKHFADVRHHIVFSCDFAVDKVGARRNEKHAERPVNQIRLPFKSADKAQRHEYGNAQHSEIRDDVGDKPDIFLFENKFIGFVFHKITPKRYSF